MSLKADLVALGEANTWHQASEQLIMLLDSRFHGSSEHVATDIVTLRQDSAALAFMDEFAPPPTIERIRDAVGVRIDSHGGKHGKSGTGVTVGALADAAGRDLDVVVILGAAEGLLPVPRREDPLLPAELTGHTPATLWTLNIATTGLHSRQPEPNEWSPSPRQPAWRCRTGTEPLVAACARRTRRHRCRRRRLAEANPGADRIVVVESFDVAAQNANPRIGASAASETEWRLRALAAVPAEQRQTVLTDPIVCSGMRMRSDRLRGRFTRFNGNVHDVRDLLTVFDNPVSPTRLEDWVKSPYRFFLTSVLGAKELPDPDEATEIDALTRGNLIHTILERYVIGTIDGAAQSLSRLTDIADDVLGSAERDNPGWLGHLWAQARGTIMYDLREWHRLDTEDHSDGWTPTHAEHSFGLPPRAGRTRATRKPRHHSRSRRHHHRLPGFGRPHRQAPRWPGPRHRLQIGTAQAVQGHQPRQSHP